VIWLAVVAIGRGLWSERSPMMKILGLVLLAAFLGACSAPSTEDPAESAADADAVSADELEAEGEDGMAEVPPEGALAASVILARLEGSGYAPIVEAEFEDGLWEIEYVVDGEEHEIQVDPMSGEVVPKPQGDDEE
jgi:hypothetical protein